MSKRILYLGLDPSHINGEVTHWPVIRIVPRPISELQVLQDFNHYSHVIITSKSSVAILRDYLPHYGFNLDTWKEKITLAVGQVTAKHLIACGIQPIIASEETAEGIIQELQKLSLKEAHLFWPHSSQTRPLIKEFLLDQEIRHTTCILYDPESQIPGDLPHLDTFDEIIFTSPSTVNAFLKIFDIFPANVQLTPIGSITARYIEHCKTMIRSMPTLAILLKKLNGL